MRLVGAGIILAVGLALYPRIGALALLLLLLVLALYFDWFRVFRHGAAQPKRSSAIAARSDLDPHCPDCGEEISPPPPKRRKCPSCRQQVYIRDRPTDRRRRLVTAADAETIDKEWAVFSELPEVEVVGESEHQDSLWSIVGEPDDDRAPTWAGLATLVAEPTNRHDPNAVQVRIDGEVVGYLRREDATRLQPAVAVLKKHAGADLTVPVEAKGGFLLPDSDDRANIGITLRFSPKDVVDAARKAAYAASV